MMYFILKKFRLVDHSIFYILIFLTFLNVKIEILEGFKNSLHVDRATKIHSRLSSSFSSFITQHVIRSSNTLAHLCAKHD
jgi:hypothetical protein